jgi:hypothetical protein
MPCRRNAGYLARYRCFWMPRGKGRIRAHIQSPARACGAAADTAEPLHTPAVRCPATDQATLLVSGVAVSFAPRAMCAVAVGRFLLPSANDDSFLPHGRSGATFGDSIRRSCEVARDGRAKKCHVQSVPLWRPWWSS